MWKIGFWDSDFLAKSAARSLQIAGVCGHIQSRADSNDGNRIMAMVMIAPEVLIQVD
jgi:hypothetical protein